MTSLVTNPVDVVRTRIMTELTAPDRPRFYTNPLTALVRVRMRPSRQHEAPVAIAQCISWQISAAEGLAGLYKGFVPSYLRLGSASVVACITSPCASPRCLPGIYAQVFMLYEQLRTLTGIPTI